MKGWGVSLQLANCSEEEKALAKKREKSLCHTIGTYCHKKTLGKCVTKKTSFCCFGSKLARLVQAQGRAQLGLGWGEPEAPDCRALTVEELTRLNLSKLDFRELFEDMMKKYRPPDVQKLQERTLHKIEENLKQMESGVKPPTLNRDEVKMDEEKAGE
jgi:conjugal transfer mating pair stabilization protein TraN